MRSTYKILIVAAASFFYFSGCMNKPELYATDIKGLNNPFVKHMNHFGSNETLYFVVKGYSGQIVGLAIFDLPSGKTVFSSWNDKPIGQKYYWAVPQLVTGLYIAKLIDKEKVLQSYVFSTGQ